MQEDWHRLCEAYRTCMCKKVNEKGATVVESIKRNGALTDTKSSATFARCKSSSRVWNDEQFEIENSENWFVRVNKDHRSARDSTYANHWNVEETNKLCRHLTIDTNDTKKKKFLKIFLAPILFSSRLILFIFPLRFSHLFISRYGIRLHGRSGVIISSTTTVSSNNIASSTFVAKVFVTENCRFFKLLPKVREKIYSRVFELGKVLSS